MENLSTQILNTVDSMPTFPGSVSKILKLTSDRNVSAKEVIQIIKYDPVLTIKILRLVNSAYFGLRKRVTSINQAFVLLGLNVTKNLLLTVAVIGSLPKLDRQSNFCLNDFLLHSLGTAVIAKILAKKIKNNPFETEDYFIGGLLHDFGKIVLVYYAPNDYNTVLEKIKTKKSTILEEEQNFFECQHTLIGKALAKHWNLPVNLQNVMLQHHDPQIDNRDNLIPATIYVANALCREKNIGFAGDNSAIDIREDVLDFLNLDSENLSESLNGLEEELQKAKIFLQL